MKNSLAAGAVALGFGLVSPAALASTPASDTVAIPTTPGQTVVVEWTGTALPGASGAGSTNAGCAQGGPDDSHTITLTGAVAEDQTVTADFHIQWEGGPTTVAVTDPDLVLSVFQGLGDLGAHSDGGVPEENVGLTNPVAGDYSAIVCPFTASKATPYHGRLKLTALAPQACLTDRGNTIANGPALPGSAVSRDPDATSLPNFDLFSVETSSVAKAIPTDLHGRYQSAIYDRTLGTPTFLWARTDAKPAAVGALAPRELLIESARAQLRGEAKELHLNADLIDQAEVTDAGFNGAGPAVVRFSQRVNGIEVFQRSLNVLLDRNYKPIAVSGYFATDFDRSAMASFAHTPAQAVAAAWSSLGGSLSASALTPSETRDGWQWFERPAVSGTHVFERGPRAKAVYYPRNGALEPAYHVELFANAKANGELLAYALVVSAVDGSILHRENLKADAFSYRVYADNKGPVYAPYDSPLGNDYAPFRGNAHPKRVGVTANLVTLDNAGIVTGDPWLADTATSTLGNHVDACKDTYDQSVSTPAGGLAVPPPVNSCVKQVEPNTKTTGDHSFDYAIAPDEDPAHTNAVNAAVVNLFYMNNWLHDQWYNHGFDEAAGNAQTSNYGRGGKEADPVLAQGQDGSGRNNANMATPADGSSPVMQQYLFDGNLTGEVREVAPVAGPALNWTVIHDTGKDTYNFDGDLALANDGLGVSPSDGCGPAYPVPAAVSSASPAALPLAPVAPPDQNLRGKIALIDRGNCNTTYKIQFALASGAIGLIVVNNVDGDPPTNIGNLDIPLAPVQPTHYVYAQLPTLFIRKDDGAALKAQIASGAAVKMHMERTPSVDVDGTLDNQIIAHEYFHYVHHRLTASSSRQAGAMSEGWGDIDAFMLTVRPGDKLVPGNADFGGAYALATYVANDFFKGIRRAPYTTSFADNAYTFKHISDGTPTPDGGAGAGNSEVHSAGEIWANQMFECYVGVLTNPHNSFDDAQSKMRDYIIGGFKMTPADATYTEARDAVLSIALATDAEDYKRCSHGFARRGNGLNAVAPARSSTTLTGVVEDYAEFVCAGGAKAEAVPAGRGLLVGAFGPGLLLPLLGIAALRRRRK